MLNILSKIITLTLILITLPSYANLANDIGRLRAAYPNFITKTSDQNITWFDGTKMQVQDNVFNKTQQEKLDHPSLADQMQNVCYQSGKPTDISKFNPTTDPGRIRYQPFFRKMYGNSKEEVTAKVVTIYWMPTVFDHQYPLRVTTINEVNKKLTFISNELEKLVAKHPEYLKYLSHPGGTFEWRAIAGSHRLSLHSFGMTIDINAARANYWRWDLKRSGKPVNENTALTYRNDVPWDIVLIFEKHGFIWGGKWHHYDTMHFEYRPELLITNCK